VVGEYSRVWDELEAARGVRGVFVRAKGKLFCAGADAKWMLKTATYATLLLTHSHTPPLN